MSIQTLPPIQLISAVIGRNWTELARTASLDNWREILAALVTYAGPEEFASLCGEWSYSYPIHGWLCTRQNTMIINFT